MSYVLWKVDGKWGKFKNASNATEIPKVFKYEKPFRVVTHVGDTKKKIPQLKQEDMAKEELMWIKLLTSSWMRRSNFRKVNSYITQLRNSFVSVAVYLENKNREI